jgi:hypothetical protein
MKYKNLILKIFLLYFLFFTKNICMDNQKNFKNQILIDQFTPQNLREKFIPNEFNRYLTPLKNREQSFGNMDGKLSKSFLSTNNNNNDNLSTNFQFQSDISQNNNNNNNNNIIINQNNNTNTEKKIFFEINKNNLNETTNKLQNIRDLNKKLKEQCDIIEEQKKQYEKNFEIFRLQFNSKYKEFILNKLNLCENINIENVDLTNIPGYIFYTSFSPKKSRLKNFTNKIIEEYYLLQIKQEEEMQYNLNKKLEESSKNFEIQKQNDDKKITDTFFSNSSNKI